MSIFTIILLLTAGTVMILLELFLLPGLVVGIMGAGLCFWGTYEAFHTLGPNWGWFILIATILTNGFLAWYAFQNIHRTRFAVKKKIDGRVNEFNDYGLKEGDEGVTLTDLRPEGRALFGDKIISVWSFENRFLSANQPIKVTKIADNKIFVNHFELNKYE